MIESQNNKIEDDEISLKEIILKFQEYYREVIKNWKLLGVITFSLIIIFFIKALQSTPLYTAPLTFMINEDEGGRLGGGVGAILGIVGLGGGGSGKYNLDKILELVRSRKIIQHVILDKVEINGKMDYLGNHIINIYDLHDKWKDDRTGFMDFLFQHADIDQFSDLENRGLKTIYGKIVGSKDEVGFMATSYNEDSGIMTISVTTESEELAISLTNVLFEKLSTFYVSKTIEKQKSTFDIVEAKVDSVKQLLSNREYALANVKDSNRGIYTAKEKLKELRLMRDVEVLNILYGESLKNLEIADFSLKNKTPFVQLIDAPISPIAPSEDSKLKAILLGGLLGGGLSVGLIIARFIYRNTLADVNLE